MINLASLGDVQGSAGNVCTMLSSSFDLSGGCVSEVVGESVRESVCGYRRRYWGS